jgi:predicted XRE-type DNA-binding protein
MRDHELDIVRGSDHPFRDAGLSDPDTKLMKADLAAGIVRVLKERALSGARAAGFAGVTEADISRIRNADLNRFTVDRLVRILNRLDSRVQVAVSLRPRGHPIEDGSASRKSVAVQLKFKGRPRLGRRAVRRDGIRSSVAPRPGLRACHAALATSRRVDVLHLS